MNLFGVSFKVAFPIIIAGVFVIVTIIAINFGNITPTLFIIVSLLIVYIFSFGFATGQRFSMPVKKLLKRANELSGGDLKSRVYIQGKDELGQLAQAFNKIAEELEQSRSQSDTLEKSIDLKVKARTEGLEETINALEQKVKNRTLELQRISEELDTIKNTPVVAKNRAVSAKKKAKKEVPVEMVQDPVEKTEESVEKQAPVEEPPADPAKEIG